jgi:L-threonylcarbamoyladenylate synthase
MPCEVLRVTADDHEPLRRAADVLRRGGLVAFPTETVYGLGANALDATAVERIFTAKGRPAHNPVIVHVADIDAARSLVTEWPATAQRLAERFWPGPLTLVLPRREHVPDIVAANGPTVGIRVPAHPVALDLLRACGLPVAAPSANRSTAISPTRAEHVLHSLGDRIDLLLDGGATSGGLESTVIDLTGVPRLLRAGLVAPGELEAVVGTVLRSASPDGPARSPGQMHRHYAPRTPLETTPRLANRVAELAAQGLRVGCLGFVNCGEAEISLVLPVDASTYAARLYDALHRLDNAELDRIVVELPPATEAWLAVQDRLRRAAAR